MKKIASILCIFSLLCASDPIEITASSEEITVSEIVPAEEIAAFDLVPLLEQPISQTDIQIPAPVMEPSIKRPWIAVSLSSLFPGLGHVYLGDMKTAGGIMGTMGVGTGLIFYPNAPETFIVTNVATLQATSFYSLYAAYRDTRLHNGLSNYSYQMPIDDLADLTTAPFRWSILKKPEVWGGVLGALAVGVATVYFTYSNEVDMRVHKAAMTDMPWIALPVGIGEESFFRGYLQSMLSENLNPTAGWILSSLLFAAAHIPNAQQLDEADRWRYYTVSLPLISGIGAYCGWLTSKNHSLQESVAFHTWYDGILFTLGAFANQTAATGRPGFAISLPF